MKSAATTTETIEATPDQIAILRFLSRDDAIHGVKASKIAAKATRLWYGAMWAIHRLRPMIRQGLVQKIQDWPTWPVCYRITAKGRKFIEQFEVPNA